MAKQEQRTRTFGPPGSDDELAVLVRKAMSGDPAATWSLYAEVVPEEIDSEGWEWEAESVTQFMSLAQFITSIERFERLPLGRAALGGICRKGGFDLDGDVWLLWYARAAAAGDACGFENLAVRGSRLEPDELERNHVWARRAAVLLSGGRFGDRGTTYADYVGYYVDAAPNVDGGAELQSGINAAVDGDHESARSAFERAAALGQDQALILLALLSDAAGDELSARAHLEQIAPTLRVANLWLGVRAECDGDIETARRWYGRALEESAREGEDEDEWFAIAISRSSLGAIALREGDVEGARALWRKSGHIDWDLLDIAQAQAVERSEPAVSAAAFRSGSRGRVLAPIAASAEDFAEQVEATASGDPEATWAVYLRVLAGDVDDAFRSGDVDVEDVRLAIERFPDRPLERAAVARIAALTSLTVEDPDEPMVEFWAVRSAALGDAQAMGVLGSRADHDQPDFIARNLFWAMCGALHGDERLAQRVEAVEAGAVRARDAEVMRAFAAARAGDVEEARAMLEVAAAANGEQALLLLVVLRDVESGEPVLHDVLAHAAQRSQLACLWQGLRAESLGDAVVAREAYERVIRWVAPGELGDEHLHAWVARFCLGGIAWRDGDLEGARAQWQDLTIFDLYGGIGDLCRAAIPAPRSPSKNVSDWLDGAVNRVGIRRLVVIGFVLFGLMLLLQYLGVGE